MPASQQNQPPAADQFWLMTAETPAGPFTVPQIHAEMAAGRATWQTRACPVGGGVWQPLLKTAGIGPDLPESSAAAMIAGPASPVTAANPMPAESPTPVLPTPGFTGAPVNPEPPATVRPGSGRRKEQAGKAGGAVMAAVSLAVVGAVGFGMYEWVRPLTAFEVCKKLERITTTEVRQFATPRMHPLIDAMLADQTASDPNDTFNLTREIDGPRPDTKLVGFQGAWFSQEAGARVRVEGHVAMVRSDGWKIDDIVFTGVEGSSLPGPMSLVDEHRRSTVSPGAPHPTPAAPKSSAPPAGPTKRDRSLEGRLREIKDTFGWGGMVFVGLSVLSVWFYREKGRW